MVKIKNAGLRVTYVVELTADRYLIKISIEISVENSS